MKKLVILLIGILSFTSSFSQHWNSKIWYFGGYAGIDFNSSTPVAIGNSGMSQSEGCSTMTDENGQLLFYTNGINVWNRNHQVMPNGAGLAGNQSSTQGALIIRQPQSTSIYYIFVTSSVLTTNATYSVVDMSLNGGLGDLVYKNLYLMGNSSEKLTATLKGNGIDYWVVLKQRGNHRYCSLSFTSSGIDVSNPVVTNIGYVPNPSNGIGWLRISPNGSKICAAYRYDNMAQLLDFDNNSGHLTNAIDLPTPSGTYGVEFSPDNTKLYTVQQYDFIVRQYDLLAGSPAAIQNSAIEVVHLPPPHSGSSVALGPDGKIYVGHYNRNFISVIDQPNLTGTACNFIFGAIPLTANTSCQFGLPNQLYYVPPPPGCPQQVYSSNNIILCPGQSYQLPSGVTVNTAGTYQDTVRNQASCDSIIHITNVYVVTTSFANITTHICSNQTYLLPSGTVVNTTGIYHDTIRSSQGCDSIVTLLDLTVYPNNPSYADTTVHICIGQSFHLPSGGIVYNTGVYTDVIHNVNGCDSLITTVNLFAASPTQVITQAQICAGQTYQLPSGVFVSAQGYYNIDTIHNAWGCDSIIHRIYLTVVNRVYRNTSVRICAGQTYQTLSGTILSIPGIYHDTLRSMIGCDSIVSTITLATLVPTNINNSIQICSGHNYQLPWGGTVNTPGIYADTIRSLTGGCDSIITTVNLSVVPASQASIAAQICSGHTYQLPSGTVVNATGLYSDTIRSVSSCDSIITTVNLTLFPVSHINNAAQICPGQAYQLPSGAIVNTAGNYNDTIRSVNACDSIITTLQLSVLTANHVSTAAQICSGQTYQLPSGTIVNTTGFYQDTIRSAGGCDSIISTVNISAQVVSYANNSIQICFGQTYQLPSGTIVNVAGIYQDTIRNIHSCDSIITTVNLSVFPVSYVSNSVQVCSGQTYQLPSGTIVNTAGIYQDTVRSVSSCDSVIATITLSVFPVTYVTAAAQFCSGQSYQLPSGTIVNAAGIYQDTVRSIASCDSVITTITLSVFPVSYMNTSTQICSGQSYQLPSGTIVNAAGIYQDTIRSIHSCDSIITTVNLTVFPVTFTNSTAQVCSNQTYQLPNGEIVNSAGFYQDTIRAVNSCDSIINTIHLLVNNVSSYNLTDSMLEGEPYVLPWGQTVNATGVYQTTLINSLGCDSVITVTLKQKQQIAECITLKNAFTPNGDGINDYWILYRYSCFKRMEVSVFDRYGIKVYYSADYRNDWNGKYRNKELPDGTYYSVIRIISYDGKEKVFKNNVTILR